MHLNPERLFPAQGGQRSAVGWLGPTQKARQTPDAPFLSVVPFGPWLAIYGWGKPSSIPAQSSEFCRSSLPAKGRRVIASHGRRRKKAGNRLYGYYYSVPRAAVYIMYINIYIYTVFGCNTKKSLHAQGHADAPVSLSRARAADTGCDYSVGTSADTGCDYSVGTFLAP